MFTRLRSQFAVSVSGLCSPVFVVLVTFRLESVDVLVVVAVLVVWLLVGCVVVSSTVFYRTVFSS